LPGEHDDLAIAYDLAIEARTLAARFGLKYPVEQIQPARSREWPEEDNSPLSVRDSGRGYLGIG
jgi:hypothetical protein